jgi:hypothetical protein
MLRMAECTPAVPAVMVTGKRDRLAERQRDAVPREKVPSLPTKLVR